MGKTNTITSAIMAGFVGLILLISLPPTIADLITSLEKTAAGPYIPFFQLIIASFVASVIYTFFETAGLTSKISLAWFTKQIFG